MEPKEFLPKANTIVSEVVQKFNSFYGVQMPVPELVFAHMVSRRAGQANYQLGKIQINPKYVPQFGLDMLEDTVPHEVGHFACKFLFPRAKQAHGPEFRLILNKLGYPKASITCHSYDADFIQRRRIMRFPVTCLKCGATLLLTRYKLCNIAHLYHRSCGGRLFNQNAL